ncbi:ABC transporter permease [Bacteroidota bacterium]
MIRNYIKIAIRNLNRNRLFSIINIFGLVIGITCTLIIILWINYEYSYDCFHEKKSSIYRVSFNWYHNQISARSPGLLSEAVKEEIDEIVYATRMFERPKMAFTYDPGNNEDVKEFYEENFYLVDPDFLEVFSFPVVMGNSKTALKEGLVITEEIAHKYFGDENPIGKVFNVNNWYTEPVSAVVKNIPKNSSIHFDILSNIQGLDQFWPGGFTWGNFVHTTYIEISENANPEYVANKIYYLYQKYSPYEELKSELRTVELQSIKDIHLDNHTHNVNIRTANKKFISIFLIVAIFILIIACVNYINLTTSIYSKRIKEVGIRKTHGATSNQVFVQYLGESIIMAIIATFFAVILLESVLTPLNNFLNTDLIVKYDNLKWILYLLAMILVTGIIAGIFPVLYISKQKPMDIFHSNDKSNREIFTFRSLLVVLQFVISITLIISTLIINLQLDYIKNKDIGFTTNNILCIPLKDNFCTKYSTVKNEIEQLPYVEAVAMKSSLPTFTLNSSDLEWFDSESKGKFNVEVTSVDHDFISTLDLEIMQGRNFSKELPTDINDAFIINNRAAELMNLENPIGAEVEVWGKKGRIIGIFKDANFLSLRNSIHPVVLRLATNFIEGNDELNLFGFMMIRYQDDNIVEVLKEAKKIWKEFNPKYPFEYLFLDETYDNLYKKDEQNGRILSWFTILAIIISCLGLFGLVTFTIQARTKEIGIRKVNGAKTNQIIMMLSKDVTWWIILAFFISCPIAFFFMNNWIQNFAYRTNIDLWIFFFAGILALFVALITVSWQSYRAASRNPVEALRYE